MDHRPSGSTVALLLLCAVQFMDALDVSSMGVALPAIQRQFDLSEGGLQWVISAYVLGYGGFLLFGGRTADLLGRRRTLLAATGAFLVISLLACLSPDGPVLIVARFAKGMTAAFTAPAALALITTMWPRGPARNRALGMFGATAALGYCAGLVGGGLLTEVSWHLVLALPVPIAAVVLVLGPRVLSPDGLGTGRRQWDVGGALSATGGLLLLIAGITTAPQDGWSSPGTLGALALSAALLVTFVRVEARHPAPLLPLRLFRIPSVRYANVVAFALTGAYVAFQFITTLYLQNVHGWSPVSTAMGFLPIGIVIAMTAPRSARAVSRFGSTLVLAVGLTVLASGYALLTRIQVESGYAAVVLPTMLLVGVGAGLLFTATNITAVSQVPDADQGIAGGLITSSFQVGGAVMLAVVSAIIDTAHQRQPHDPIAGYASAIAVIAAVVLVALVVVLAGWRTLSGGASSASCAGDEAERARRRAHEPQPIDLGTAAPGCSPGRQ